MADGQLTIGNYIQDGSFLVKRVKAAMPFTFAHPAAVVPLLNKQQKYLIPSALIVGSITPDIEYFLRLKLITKWSHTIPGIFTFCLPVGLFVLWLYHAFQKDAIVPLLPSFVQKRTPPPQTFSFLPVQKFAAICVSIAIGAVTHIVWDGFTHSNGFWVERTLFLQESIQLGVFDLKRYELLQDVSTLIGFVVLGIWFWHPRQRTSFLDLGNTTQLTLFNKFISIVSLVIGTILVSILLSVSIRQGKPFHTTRDIFRHIAIISIPSIYIVVVSYSIVFAWLKRFF